MHRDLLSHGYLYHYYHCGFDPCPVPALEGHQCTKMIGLPDFDRLVSHFSSMSWWYCCQIRPLPLDNHSGYWLDCLRLLSSRTP